MNSSRVSSFGGGFVVIVLMGLCSWHGIVPTAIASRIVQRSDGCGPHPLVALLAASRPYGSGGGTPSLSEILRTVKANPEVWATMSSLLRRYDDCIRAGDGLHYKRGGNDQILNARDEETSADPSDDTFPITSFF